MLPNTPYLRAWALLLGLTLSAGVAQGQLQRPEKAKIRLLADRTSYAAGTTATLAAVMTIDEGWHTNSHTPTFDYLIPTIATFELPAGWAEPSLVYPPGVMRDFAFVEEPISVYEGRVEIRAQLPVPAEASGEVALAVAVRYQACDHEQCLPPVSSRAELKLKVGAEGESAHAEVFGGGSDIAPLASSHGGSATAAPASATPPASAVDTPSLVLMLLLALVGGLVLNVMPCVLPVLSLKVFGLMRSGTGRAEVSAGALATAAGILVSFWALALAAVLARGAGLAVGWGVQFQQPGFVAFLAVVVLLFSLNLWGLFEVPQPSRLVNRLSSKGPQEGVAGHFVSGVFATLMATPCSAPFLGTAVTFGLSQPAAVIFAVFTAVGLGMALPFLALAAAPGAARLLPKPGAWMETVRGLMGFLLAAAAVWLFYVLAGQVSAARLAVLQLALLGLALCIWLRHQLTGRAPALRLAAAAGIVATVVLAIAVPATAGDFARERLASNGSGAREWIEFDRARAEQLADGGRQVFADVTADWCLTCKWNEHSVLASDEVLAAFDRHDVVTMKADWTNYDEDIRTFLQDHGRTGIPFYLLYRPQQPPYVFGELLTRDRVLAALEGRDG